MTFNSWEFLLFYPIVAILYFALPKKMKWPMLLIASYFFYMCYQAELVFLIFGTTLISWIASNAISRSEKKGVRKLCLALTLTVCLGVLFFYKYFDFLAGSAVSLIERFGGNASPIALNLILPVGISFYTFQTLSYVIDVYRGDVEPEKNFFFYALFVSFFPQLVAGPIERPGNLIPQLKEPHAFNADDAKAGAKFMILGFFKKVCVADIVAIYVNAVYNDVSSASAWSIVIATVLFAVQIYCDFSGYTDIAIGCARVMGIRLMKNFNMPYTAKTIKEFWSRWHISLSTWFKDYLYIPLGGNRCSRFRHLMNLLIVFLVSGLWHGANWTFVIWGLLHGVYQVIGTLTYKGRNKLLEHFGLSEKSAGIRALRTFNTFILVCIAWLLFRANSISDAGILLSKIFSGAGVGLTGSLEAMGLGAVEIISVVVSIGILYLMDKIVTYEDNPSSVIVLKNGAFAYFVWVILLVWTLLIANDMTSTFIYFQF